MVDLGFMMLLRLHENRDAGAGQRALRVLALGFAPSSPVRLINQMFPVSSESKVRGNPAKRLVKPLGIVLLPKIEVMLKALVLLSILSLSH